MLKFILVTTTDYDECFIFDVYNSRNQEILLLGNEEKLFTSKFYD